MDWRQAYSEKLVTAEEAVSTMRADVMYVVTEYNVADLWQKTTSQRLKSMISIAHPEFRDQLSLLKTAKERKNG